MPQEEKRISARELISAERVMELWSVSDSELIEEIKRGKFAVLFCSKKPRKSPNGEILLICWEGTYKNVYYNNDFPHNENTYYDFSNVYFYAIDIDIHQREFPHLAMPTTESNPVDNKSSDQSSYYVSFAEMQNLSELSIVQLGSIVQDKGLGIYYKERDGMDIERMKPFNIRENGFQNWLAYEGFFDIRDLIPMKDKLVELKLFFENKDISSKSSVAEELKKNLSDAQCRIAELERQLQELRQENESLKAGGTEVESASPDCAACPSYQKLEDRLEIFKIGIRMALRCAADGSAQSKEAHLALWRELHGVKDGKPNRRYFDAFRAALNEAPHLKCPDPRQK